MNNKGFTLIELLAVVVIIGLIMGIAIPNTITMIDKHKMNSYLGDARTFSSMVKSKLRTDRSLEMPETTATASVVTLEYLNTNNITKDPYGNEYDKKRSFVGVILNNGSYEYYVHLVSCKLDTGCDEGIYNDWRGITVTKVGDLGGDNRYELVKSKGAEADAITKITGYAPFNNKTIYINGLVLS